MKQIEFIILAISLVATAVVSVLFGWAGSLVLGSFWGWFGITFLIQILGFVIFNSILIQRENYLSRQTELIELEAFSKFTIQLTCGYCRQPNTVPIQLNQRNTFKCESCNQTNSVTMQFTAVPVTTPIDSVKIPVEDTGTIEFKVSA